MLISNKYNVPDKCPEGCVFNDSLIMYGQGSPCTRCPVMCCKMPVTDEDKKYMPIVSAKEYRKDWAKEWNTFFETGKIPQIRI